MTYSRWLRPLLFSLESEVAHESTLALLRAAQGTPGALATMSAMYRFDDPSLAVEAMGVRFPNPIGLAAGSDKNAKVYRAMGALGFGFIEVGTLTAKPQSGNPKPRLFRLPIDRALVNRMGFNNEGAAAAAKRLVGSRPTPVGVNIGRSKAVSNDEAIDDYRESTRLLAPLADYFVVNVSSPNTPGLRDLQAVESLRPLLAAVRDEADRARDGEPRLPLLVKIAPDLADEDVDAVADLALELGLDGIIATNTTIGRANLTTPRETIDACGGGGLSGAPLKIRSLKVLKRLRRRTGGRVTLVSVGGIETVDDVWERLRAGASLVQIYTAMVYEGPGLPGHLCRQLAERLKDAGASSISDIIGADAS
ncbi:quinone-dependent dihydroorotate dehydrogenase [bacterium]|nr:quinone-dependent dihydroorotate dehydrogenase [bacterium]